MSNRNGFTPSLNSWKNAEFTGVTRIDGDLTVTGTITLPTNSGLKTQQISLFVPTIVSATAAVCVLPVRIAGTITKISVSTNVATTTGPATFTPSIIRAGATTAITDGVMSVPTTNPASQAVTATPSAANVLVVDDVLKIVVGGTNDNTGTAHISFQVTVA